jgi:hypothetical protein
VLDSTAKIIDAIINAAANPKVDLEKMKGLIAMRDHMEALAAKVAFDENLSLLQAELPVIPRRGLIEVLKKDERTGERTGRLQQSTPYALWEDIAETIKPILSKYGFSLSFRTPHDPSGKISVTGILARGGHREETTLPFQHDSTGSKNAAQAIVSAVSYGKRTVAGMLLNIITRGEDDDGKRTGDVPNMISTEQLAELMGMANEAGADKERFCNMMKVASFADIPALRFDEAKAQLERKLRDKKARVAAAKAKMGASDFPGDKPMPKRNDHVR